MTKIAVKEFFPDDFPIKVDSIEVDNGPSIPTVYMIDKLSAMHKDTHEFSFIMGSDLIKGLHYWDDGQCLINKMKCIVFLRKGFPNEDVVVHENFPKNKPILVDEEESLIGVISSTEIRKRVQIAAEQSRPFYGIAGLVMPTVIKYI